MQRGRLWRAQSWVAMSLSHLFSQGSRIYNEGKICKNHSWLRGSGVFPACQGTRQRELKDCDNCMWPSQIWARQSPGAEKGRRHKIPPQPRSCLHLVVAGRQNISFLQGSDIGCINHIPGQAPRSGEVGFWFYGWLWFQAALDISTHVGRHTGYYVPQREEVWNAMYSHGKWFWISVLCGSLLRRWYLRGKKEGISRP